MNPTTLVLVSGMFALIVGALILFALMSGIVAPRLALICTFAGRTARASTGST